VLAPPDNGLVDELLRPAVIMLWRGFAWMLLQMMASQAPGWNSQLSCAPQDLQWYLLLAAPPHEADQNQ